ncbi:hypothetical protein CDV36_008044 [Fusarium kuroshium]|uniref:Carrier domain-containing protein n=1 Tax=Fusarium kuroshium TaxID=2010991 RepID=A0A3M2S434_9HYPO|nr:hypothetical protein CDV36_008044 [Fusarium kuroshium]
MRDVQILVISRQDNTKICSVGEQGEIYFRAAALAEGYLGDPQKTAEKFVDNWLVDNAKRPWPVSPYVVPEISEWNRWLEAQNHEDIEDEGVEMGPTVVYLKRFRQDASEEDLKSWEALSETEKTLATQWSTLIPGLNAKTIRPESNFFDYGEHSLLAQQLLLNIRKSLGADITIGVLYANPSLRGLGSQVDCLRSGQAATVDKAVDTAYAESSDELINTLHDKHQSAGPDALSLSSSATFFLTSATGFLGAYLVKEILGRKITKLIVHIHGAKGLDFAKDRLTRSLKGYGLWQDSWAERIGCVLGDLSKPLLGLDDASWKHVTETADAVVHNAAYLEEFVSAGPTEKDQEQSALMPLFHMETSNLPSTTRAPELDDRNAVDVLKADADRWTGVDDSAGEGITRQNIGRHLPFLAEIKFMRWPTGRGRELPPIAAEIARAQAQWGVGGRGGAA